MSEARQDVSSFYWPRRFRSSVMQSGIIDSLDRTPKKNALSENQQTKEDGRLKMWFAC